MDGETRIHKRGPLASTGYSHISARIKFHSTIYKSIMIAEY